VRCHKGVDVHTIVTLGEMTTGGRTQMSGLVSGEAVELDLSPARLASRGLAFAIDATVQILLLIAFLLGGTGIAASLGGDAAITATLGLVGVVTALVIYPVVWETTTRGRSLGKLALGLRVVRDDGGAIRFRQALIRAMFAVIEIWLTTGVIALFASLLSKDGKRLGDQFAGTNVVRERSKVGAAQIRWTMPPRMAPWAQQADASHVPTDLVLEARTFVLRAASLTPDARWRMSVDLAERVRPWCAPAPPTGIHPEELLIAVLALRQSSSDMAPGLASAPLSSPVSMPAPPQPPAAPAAPAPAVPVAPATPVDPSAASASGGFAPPG
jgi:uncharacterized RDD family membrane protein YckC